MLTETTPDTAAGALAAALTTAATAAEVSTAVAGWRGDTMPLWRTVLAHAPALETGLLFAAVFDDAEPHAILGSPAVTDEQRRVLATWAMGQLADRTPHRPRARRLLRAMQGRPIDDGGVDPDTPAVAPVADVLADELARDALFAASVPAGRGRRGTSAMAATAEVLLDLPHVTTAQLERLLACHQQHGRATRVLRRVAAHPNATPALWQQFQAAWPTPTWPSVAGPRADLPAAVEALCQPGPRQDPAVRAALWAYLADTDATIPLARDAVEEALPDGPVAAWILARRDLFALAHTCTQQPLVIGRHLTPWVLEELLLHPRAEVRAAATLAAAAMRPDVVAPDASPAVAAPYAAWIAARVREQWGGLLIAHARASRLTRRYGVTWVGDVAVELADREVVAATLDAVLAAAPSVAERTAALERLVTEADRAVRMGTGDAGQHVLLAQLLDLWQHTVGAAIERHAIHTLVVPALTAAGSP